jgi:wyosine [tRNA(Phe)-imidazoG37] synthetase (radical SAM superfamily)
MAKATREFQVFVKPVGSICNLDCHYCYYLKKEQLYPKGESFRMPDDILEEYIVQHIDPFFLAWGGADRPWAGLFSQGCGAPAQASASEPAHR